MFGFHQAFGWDYVTIIAVMAGLVGIPSVMADKLLSYEAKELFESSNTIGLKLLGGWVVFAFVIYTRSDTPFHQNAYNEFAAFAGLWWSCYPYYCAFIVILDRAAHIFGKEADPFERRNIQPEPKEPPSIEPDRADNVFKFDPNRFRK